MANYIPVTDMSRVRFSQLAFNNLKNYRSVVRTARLHRANSSAILLSSILFITLKLTQRIDKFINFNIIKLNNKRGVSRSIVGHLASNHKM